MGRPYKAELVRELAALRAKCAEQAGLIKRGNAALYELQNLAEIDSADPAELAQDIWGRIRRLVEERERETEQARRDRDRLHAQERLVLDYERCWRKATQERDEARAQRDAAYTVVGEYVMQETEG